MNTELKTFTCSLLASQKTKVSSANKRRDTVTPSPPLPLAKKRLLVKPSSIYRKTPPPEMKRKGERGSPYHRPLEPWKKPIGDPLNKIEK